MARELTEHKVRIGRLHKLAMDYADDLTTDEEIRQRNVTAEYYEDKDFILKSGGLLNVQLRGLPASGKSTVMIAEVWDTNNRLGKETTVDHILPNQIVWIQVIRRITSEQHACVGVDEIDEMGDTGYNATVDGASINSYSDLGRAHYIHRYVCSPRDTMEKNAFLFLDVVAADKEHQFTRCLLSYKLMKGGLEREQLLGYVDVDVSQVLKTTLYKRYYERKMHRLSLFSKYGILHERHIFFAKVLLDAYEELLPLASVGKVDRAIAELQIDISARNLKQVNSILGTGKFTQDLLGLLQLFTYANIENEKARKLKMTPATLTQAKVHASMRDKLMEQEKKIIHYWKSAAELESLYISNFGLPKEEKK